MMKNLTPHSLNVLNKEGEFVYIEPSGEVARVEVDRRSVDPVDGFEISETVLGEVVGLPEEQEGVLLIVSRVVKEAVEKVSDRYDLLCPGELIRDSSGKVVGCRGFSV